MSERTYEIRLSGLVPTEELLGQIGKVEVVEHEFRTVLSGRFADQAELQGLLHRLRSYGLDVVEVRRLPIIGSAATEEQCPQEEDRRE